MTEVANDPQGMNATIGFMQSYMLQKGLINYSMTLEQFNEFVHNESQSQQGDEITATTAPKGKLPDSNKFQVVSGGRDRISSDLGITIYRWAVRTLDPNLGMKIDELLNKSQGEVMEANKNSSSDDNMDTSDELIDVLNQTNLAKVSNIAEPVPGTSGEPTRVYKKEKIPEEQVELLIKEAKRLKAHMFEMPGMNNYDTFQSLVSVSQIDEDYQMVDGHIEEGLKKKLLNLKYVDFIKLIECSHAVHEEDGHNRLEIVNKNGMTFLVPVTEKEPLQISSYSHCE